MSFIDRLGEFGKNLALAPFAGARFAYEIASAPWRDEEEYNGAINTLKTAGKLAGKQLAAPFIDLIEGIETVNRPLREGISAGALAVRQADPRFGGTPSALFKKETWDKAIEYKDEISAGQALAPYVDPTITFRDLAGKAGDLFGQDPNKYLPQFAESGFNIFDEKQREQAYKNSLYGRVVSGTADVGVQIFADFTLVGAKVTAPIRATKFKGAIRNGDDALKAINQISAATSGEVNKFTRVLDEFAKNDTVYALNHPFLAGSDNKPLIASLLGQSKTSDEVGLVLRSSLGDSAALSELRQSRAAIAQQMDAAMGQLPAYQTDVLLQKTYEDGMLRFPSDNADDLNALRKEITDLVQRDQYFAKMIDLGETPGGNLVRTTGLRAAQLFDSAIARGRAAKFYDKPVGTPKVEVYQPNGFSRLYQKVSWLQNERPAGFIDFNDSDSYREIVATLDRARKIAPETFDDIRVRRFIEAYSGAASPAQRNKITLAMESSIWRGIYTKYGISENVATNIYNTFQRARKGAIQSLQDRGYMIDIDGSVIHAPQLQSQTADWLPIMDFDLADKLLKRHASNFKLIGDIGVRELMQDGLYGLEIVNDLFKAGSLIRLGYTMRNAVDNQLRIASAVGALASFKYLGQGVKNFGYNRGKQASRFIDNIKITAGVPSTKGQYLKTKNQFDQARKIVKTMTDDIDKLSKKLSRDPQNPELIAQLGIKQNELIEQTAARDALSSTMTKLEKLIDSKVKKARIGESKITVDTPMGSSYEIDDMFGGVYGDLFRKMASAESSWNRLTDSVSKLFETRFRSKGIGLVRPNEPNYFQAWATTLNNQFTGDPIIRRLSAGESKESIVKWMNSPDGRLFRKDLGIKSYESVQHVDRISSFLNSYVPNKELQRRLFTDAPDAIQANPEILRETFKNVDELPLIHGDLVEENLKNVGAKKIDRLVNFSMKWLGSIPEDLWARHPLATSLYRTDVKKRIEIFEQVNKRGLNADELWKAQQAARKTAIQNMKKIVFNIDRRTNLGHFMRLISPFFSAQENAYKTWLRLVSEKPYLINRANVIWNAPNRAGLVTDEEGNPVSPDQLTFGGNIWLEVPEEFKKAPIVGPGLQSLDQIGISKRSLDVIFGGDFNFSLGPYVSYPVSLFQKQVPKSEEILKWATPFGTPDNALDAVAPTWAKRQLTKYAGESSPEYSRFYQLIWLTEQHKAREQGLPYKTSQEIERMTKDFYNMRTVANLVLPFSPRFNSPYMFYFDKWREYQRTYGVDADEKFLKDFGEEFFDFTTSLSKNKTNIQSSLDATEVARNNKELVASVFADEPALVGLISNNPTGYEFSEAAYQYQYDTRVAPGSSETFRGNVDPIEAQKRTNARLGWIQYRQAMEVLDAELAKRGLKTYANKGAQDLKYIKDQVVQQLAVNEDGTPSDWYIDYLDTDGSKTIRIINGLEKILADEKFMSVNIDNPTWKSVSQYMKIRDVLANELAKRESKSIDAKANADILFLYESIVQQMKTDDIGFGDVYDRFLSQDKIYYKNITKVNQ